MKKLLFLLVLLPMLCQAQFFPTKATPANTLSPTSYYGHTAYNYLNGNICSVVLGTVTPVASGKLDTLTNVDTGFVQFPFPNKYDMLVDFAVTKISGTVSGTSYLQGSIDNATWHTITGNTTYCADCQGASATLTNTAGTKHYQWYAPAGSVNYPFLQVRTELTGTVTATYSLTAGYKE